MRARVRCLFCLDPITLIVKAGLRSRLRPDDAAECRFCREVREEMCQESFMRLIKQPGKIAHDKYWLIWARRRSNEREIDLDTLAAGFVRVAAE